MPKSKRVRNKALTKTDGKGAKLKMELVEKIRTSVDKFDNIYVFSFENMRTNLFKQVRVKLNDSRMFMGKNKVMQIALGRTDEEEYADGVKHIASDLTSSRGLLFSNHNVSTIKKLFKAHIGKDYARAGNAATEDVVFEAGPLNSMPHNMDEPLRKLGMPVMLKRGVVMLEQEFTVCRKGDVLTPEQARILKHFEYKLAEFSLKLVSRWNNGKYKSESK